LIFSAEADNNKQEDKIKVAEEELDKILHTKEPEFHAHPGHQLMWDAFILDPALEGQSEV
jgi:hypothetical protein